MFFFRFRGQDRKSFSRPNNVVNDGDSDSHKVAKDERYRTMWTTGNRDDRNLWRLTLTRDTENTLDRN
jgi:hypothetical protein